MTFRTHAMTHRGEQFNSTGDHISRAAPRSGLHFDLARTLSEAEAAWHLVYQVYCRRGLIRPNRHETYTVSEAVGPGTAVIYGQIEGLTISTLSAVSDGPEGLPLDRTHHDALCGLRREGRRLVEITLHADRRKDTERSFYATLELVRYAYWFGRYLDVTDYVWNLPVQDLRLFHHAFGAVALGRPKCTRPGHDQSQLTRIEADAVLKDHDRYQAMADFVINPIAMDEYKHRFRFQSNAIADSRIRAFLNVNPDCARTGASNTG